MVAISISEIQRDLAGYLRRVQAGESLLITDHDRPIAEIKPAAPPSNGPHLSGSRTGEIPIDDSVDEFLLGRVFDANVPSRWREEGVADPTDDCRRMCLELAEQLFAKHGLLPSKVVASRQEGIYVEYKSSKNGRTLGIEVDNQLDVVAVVSDAKQTFASSVFEGEEAEGLLRVFLDGPAKAAGDPRAANA